MVNVITQQVRVAQIIGTSRSGSEEFRLFGQIELVGRLLVNVSNGVQLTDHGSYISVQ